MIERGIGDIPCQQCGGGGRCKDQKAEADNFNGPPRDEVADVIKQTIVARFAGTDHVTCNPSNRSCRTGIGPLNVAPKGDP